MTLLKKYIFPWVTPFANISGKNIMIMGLTQITLILLILQVNQSEILPTPSIVIQNFFTLIVSEKFLDNLLNSLFLMGKGMGLAILIATSLSYISQTPLFRFIIHIIASFRYLTLTGITFVFTLYSKDTDALRTNLLLFSIIPFFLISMLDVISKTDKKNIELCVTLRMNPFQTLWETIIVGKLHDVIEVVRSNFAICWMMITTVEGVARNLGGIGTLLLDSNKYVNMNSVLPIVLSVLIIGVLFDLLLGKAKGFLFPYSKITTI